MKKGTRAAELDRRGIVGLLLVGGAQKWEVLAWSHHDDRAVYLLLALVLLGGLHELVHTDGERTGRGVRCPNTPLLLARAWESTLACR